MSLVERALKKIQESREVTATPAPAAHAGVVREAQAREAQAAAVARQVHVPSRTVSIDRDALRNAGILPPVHEERQFAAQYRHIKRPLIRNALGQGVERLERGHLIMVASALPGEGKTFTCINLALSMALEPDLSVLLVDADVARPKLSGTFGLEREKGLLDVLRDPLVDAESLILPTDVPRLSILPAGTPMETATELLASARMRQIAEHLSVMDPHRIVVFDSSPLLLTSESRALATVVGQVVMVVRAEATPQRAVLDAVDLLGESKSVGLVLNQCESPDGLASYPYYGTEASPGPAK